MFRVFVSSTFSDLVAERAVLQARVFPALDEWCRERGVGFDAVDLRWGISEQAARDRKTIDVCLTEVRRCVERSPQLSMIVLLGDRYGWRPLPTRIGTADFTAILAASSSKRRRLLGESYRIDRNASPAHQILLPETVAVSPAHAQRQEAAVRRALDAALEHAFPPDDARHVAYAASATHLEILEALAPAGRLVTNVVCFVRERADAAGPPTDDRQRLDALEDELTRRIGHANVHRYPAGEGPELHDFESIAGRVLRDRVTAIVGESATEVSERARDSPSVHVAAATAIARNTIGAGATLRRISRWLRSDHSHPLVVTGGPGAGKSTTMARAAAEADSADPSRVVIRRFIGATPSSSDLDSLLAGLCAELDEYAGREPEALSGRFELERGFIQRVTDHDMRPIVLFIDGVDQFDEEEAGGLRALRWIPPSTAPGVKLVVSTVDGRGRTGRWARTLRGFLPRVSFVPVAPLSSSEAGDLVDRWLGLAQRRLRPRQRAALLASYQRCPLPLHLRLGFEQARAWRSFDGVPTLGSDLADLLGRQFASLGADEQHGPVLVRTTLGLLGAARLGLTDDEAVAVLSGDEAVMDELSERSPHWPHGGRLPYAVWARLRADLAPLLGERFVDGVTVSNFVHGAVRDAAGRYATAGAGPPTTSFHAGLARHFSQRSDRRQLSELAYQLTQARRWVEVVQLLTDLRFIQTKCADGRTGDLIADVDRAVHRLSSAADAPSEAAETLRAWRNFVVRQRAAFERYASVPGFVLQQAGLERAVPAVARARRSLGSRSDAGGRMWLASDSAPGDADPLIAELTGHTGGVTDCVLDGPGQLMFSSGMDGRVLMWRTSDWEIVDVVAELGSSADSCAVSPDGNMVATACADGLVRLHNRRARETTVCDHPFQIGPRRCRFTPDGLLLVSVGKPGVMVFEVATGRRQHVALEEQIVNDCTSIDPTRFSLGDCDGQVHLFDAATGTVERTLRLDEVRRTQGSCRSPDGRRLIAVGGTFQSYDDMAPFGERFMWDTGTWQVDPNGERTLSKPALNCAFIDEGRHHIVGLVDGTMLVFDTDSGATVNEIDGHDNGVRGLALSPDGRWLVSGSFDGRLKVWDASILPTGRAAGKRRTGIFCATAPDGSRSWAFTAEVDNFTAQLTVSTLDHAGGMTTETSARMARPRTLAELRLARPDPGLGLQAFEWRAEGFDTHPTHRTSPIAGDGPYWLVHAGARMSPSTFHFLPALDPDRWSNANATWCRAANSTAIAVVRDEVALVADHPSRRVVVNVVDDSRRPPETFDPLLVPISWRIGQSAFSASEDRVLLAIGPNVIALSRWGAEPCSYGRSAGPDELDASDHVTCFAEAPSQRTIVVGDESGRLHVWSAARRRRARSWFAHTGGVVDCMFLARRLIGSIGHDGTLKIWPIAGGQPHAVFVAAVGLAAFDASAATGRIVVVDERGHIHPLVLTRRSRAEAPNRARVVDQRIEEEHDA